MFRTPYLILANRKPISFFGHFSAVDEWVSAKFFHDTIASAAFPEYTSSWVSRQAANVAPEGRRAIRERGMAEGAGAA